jgi:hypothetical protein
LKMNSGSSRLYKTAADANPAAFTNAIAQMSHRHFCHTIRCNRNPPLKSLKVSSWLRPIIPLVLIVVGGSRNLVSRTVNIDAESGEMHSVRTTISEESETT